LNVSSITDNGTGDYRINFTSSLADGNYSWTGGVGYGTTTVVDGLIVTLYGSPASFQLNSSLRVITSDANSQTLYDAQYVGITINR
jgi:hypothetical protein